MGKASDLDSTETAEATQLLKYEVELQAALSIDVSIDLIAAAKRQLSFLRAVHCVPGLHRGPAVAIAIKRYYECWIPLAAQSCTKSRKAGSESTALLPPFDVQWVWHCHRLNPAAYKNFCQSRYQKVIDFPVLNDAEGEAAARERGRILWLKTYPKEPFDIMPQIRKQSTGQVYPIEEIEEHIDEDEYDLVPAIARESSFYFQANEGSSMRNEFNKVTVDAEKRKGNESQDGINVSKSYMWEEHFLRASLHRYKSFLHILRISEGKVLCVPTYDIDLMWHAHKLSPVAYANDTEALLSCVMDRDDPMEKGPNTKLGNGFNDTVRLWERTFGYPYERAGSMPRGTQSLNPDPFLCDDGGFERIPEALPWNYYSKDVNTNLQVLSPRFVVEVCIFIKSFNNASLLQENGDVFVRLRALAAHGLMKLNSPVVVSNQPEWQKLWLLQCEVETKGVAVELRCHPQSCFSKFAPMSSKLIAEAVLTWQEIEKSSTLSINRYFTLREKRRSKSNADMITNSRGQLRLRASITPPVPAPYLLKTVPDRVTDNSGKMISSVFLKTSKNEPQQGRWMSRTVLDHTGKECFVIRIRAARGIWRKGGDRPEGVDWNERVIHICQGGWTYISGYIGIAPGKVAASASPIADDIGQYKLKWSFSSGETLTISRPMDDDNWERNLSFVLESSPHGLARLLNGRRLAYEVPGTTLEDEEGFVTVVRHTPDAPQGKATALFNWKVSAMEVHPEEDVLLVLLLCTATLRSVADLGGKNYGNLFARRRAKEAKPGVKDWGSVVLENPKSQSNLMLWYVDMGHLLNTSDKGESAGIAGRKSRSKSTETEARDTPAGVVMRPMRAAV